MTQSEKFWGPNSGGQRLDPRLPPDEHATATGRKVEHRYGNFYIEHTPEVVNPRAPDLPAPGIHRIQGLVSAQGERALSDRARAVEAAVKAQTERDRVAAELAKAPSAELQQGLENAERAHAAARAVADAAERELQRVNALQKQASSSLRYDQLAKLEVQQADEAWAAEKDGTERAVSNVARQLADLLKLQRARADEVNQVRSQCRALAKEAELPWQPGRHDVHDRVLCIATAFRRALIEAGVSASDLATLTRA